MTGGRNDARKRVGLVLGAALVVGLLGAGAMALSDVAARGNRLLGTIGLDRPSIVVLAVSSAFFLASGVLRLARWRIVRERRSALVGAALLVMGGLSLPLGGLALLFPTTQDVSLLAPAIRTAAAFVVVILLVRALTTADLSHAERPGRLLPILFGTLTLAFLALLVVQGLVPPTVTGTAISFVLLAGVRAVAWYGVALYAAYRAPELPWAGRVSPLLLGMGVAETLRGMDLGRSGPWTFAALMLCLSMAALSTRSALMDLEDAVSADERGRTDLSLALCRVSDEAVELTEWREQLTHDARNACAGLRAALSILELQDPRIDPDTRERVRLAAVQEIGQIEHLLTRSADEPCAAFEVSEVVRGVAEAAWAVGARVSVQGVPVHAVGRPGDLAAVLKNLLVNAQTHAPGSQVRFRVTSDEDTVTISCADDGPGLGPEVAKRAFDRGFRGRTSPGSGLGLHGARALMREQDGDLVLAPCSTGATFLLTLPLAEAASHHPRPPVRVPSQRALGPAARQLPPHVLPVA